jgi:hypothetical protein
LLQSGVGVEKWLRRSVVAGVLVPHEGKFLLWVSKLGRQRERWWRPLAQEAYQPLNMLRSSRQVELLANELQSSQTQATKSDLMLEFRKQSLQLVSLSLRIDEGGVVLA